MSIAYDPRRGNNLARGLSRRGTEAVHSWVDDGNEGFVVAAHRSARKPADEQHPLGYGRASFTPA